MAQKNKKTGTTKKNTATKSTTNKTKQTKEVTKKIEPSIPNMSKEEAKQRVQELKKNSIAAKEKNIEEKSSSWKKEVDQKETINSIQRSFVGIDRIVKICMIIPILLFIFIIGNKMHLETTRETLICENKKASCNINLTQKVEVEFKGPNMYILKKTSTYTEEDNKWKSIEEVEKEIQQKIESIEDIKGVQISYQKSENQIILIEEYNYEKLSSKNIKEFRLDLLAKDEFKPYYEDMGYECENR